MGEKPTEGKKMGFTQVDDELLQRNDLSGNEKLLCALITRRAMESGCCTESTAALAGDLGCSVDKIKRYLNHLQKIGLITRSTQTLKVDDGFGSVRRIYPAAQKRKNAPSLTKAQKCTIKKQSTDAQKCTTVTAREQRQYTGAQKCTTAEGKAISPDSAKIHQKETNIYSEISNISKIINIIKGPVTSNGASDAEKQPETPKKAAAAPSAPTATAPPLNTDQDFYNALRDGYGINLLKLSPEDRRAMKARDGVREGLKLPPEQRPGKLKTIAAMFSAVKAQKSGTG